MAYEEDPIARLPELPRELFELSGKLDYSATAPVLTIQPESLILPEPPAVATPHADARSSFEIRKYHTQLTYPKLVCYPRPEPQVLAALVLENDEEGLPQARADRAAIARSRRYYKLTRLHGEDALGPWVCTTHYGPWLGYVTAEQSCLNGVPERWTLSAPDPGILLQWSGTWQDIPPFPNLHVFTSDLVLYDVDIQCCGGFNWCHITGSCLSIHLPCKDPILV